MQTENIDSRRVNGAKLSKEETKNPYLIFDQLFDYANADSLHEQLWEWLKISVSGAFNTKLVDKNQRYNLMVFYEHIERTIEAAHIIHIRSKNQEKKPARNK